MAGGFGLPTSFKTSGVDGTPFHALNSTTTDPGNSKVILSFTVPAGVTRSLHHIYLSCTMRGKMVIKSDGVIIGIGRNAPGKPDINFPFFPAKTINALQVVTVEFTARTSSPTVDCDVQAMASDK